ASSPGWSAISCSACDAARLGAFPSSKHKADRACIGAWGDEVCAGESRMKVVERDLVREIRNGEAQRQVRAVLSSHDIVHAESQVEYVSSGNPRRVVIVIRRAGLGNFQPCCSEAR